MKKLFLLTVAIGMMLTVHAQKTEKQMATLQHGEQTKVYYGPDALISAYKAAADSGDVVTLSSGEFNWGDNLSKSITIIGAGFEDDEVSGIKKTMINYQLRIKHADSVNGDGETIKGGRKVDNLHLEGLYINSDIYLESNNFPVRNLEIVKCYCTEIHLNSECYDVVIRQCVIQRPDQAKGGTINSSNTLHNLLVTNCYFGNLYGAPTTSTINVDHCLIYRGYSGYLGSYNYTNNILINSSIPTTASASNNILAEGSTFGGLLGENNWNGLKNAGVWAADGEDGSYSSTKDFALKYPEKYIGTDGTQVGLHGGQYAWNRIPSIPRITECTIDTQNAAVGTIKVSIKAEAQTKE